MDLRLTMSKLDSLTSWHSNWSELRVAIFGLGVSGFSVADTLAELGCRVLVVADKAEAEYLDLLEVLGVEVRIGNAFDEDKDSLLDFSSPWSR